MIVSAMGCPIWTYCDSSIKTRQSPLHAIRQDRMLQDKQSGSVLSEEIVFITSSVRENETRLCRRSLSLPVASRINNGIIILKKTTSSCEKGIAMVWGWGEEESKCERRKLKIVEIITVEVTTNGGFHAAQQDSSSGNTRFVLSGGEDYAQLK